MVCILYALYRITRQYKNNTKSNIAFKEQLHDVFDEVILKLIGIMSKVDDDRQKSLDLISKIVDKLDKSKIKLMSVQRTHENLDNTVTELVNSINREMKNLHIPITTNKETARLIKSRSLELVTIIKTLKTNTDNLKNKIDKLK